MMRRLLAAFALLLATSALAEAPKELNFGIISTESTQNLKASWQPFLADMEKAIGIKVNAFFAPDYAGIIEAMRFNKVQLAWFGNKSAMEAVDRAQGEIFAKVLYWDGTMGYYSYLGVPQESPIQSLDDLLRSAKTLSFGIGEPNSTSGFLVPSYYIFAVHNVDPKTAFKTIRSANHETNIVAVATRQIDAAVFASETWDRVLDRRPEIAKQVRIVWKSPLIPSDPMLWRKDLDAQVKRKVKDFFLAYGKSDPREKAILSELKYQAFLESSNDQLKPVRLLEVYRERTKVAADERLSAAERQQKLAELDHKLAELR
ncbi:MAG: phosphonate ABC transporter substrate-binding protein [Betaproteobacteria bacterium]|nr:phosphonate ABC transporter substrate-binding protein [Betaproteobacteria bacterium]